jgi:hypothetical protein
MTNEQCALLLELVERELQQLPVESSKTSATQGKRSNTSTRRKALHELAWHLRLASSTPNPNDSELRRTACYY